SRRRRIAPKLAFAGAAAVAAAVVAAVVLTGGPGAPRVADAAGLATQPPTAPAPPPEGTSRTRLAIGVEGVSFPDFRRYGWQALGVRRDHIDGRDATAVVYGKNGRRLGYVVVGGASLTRPGAAPFRPALADQRVSQRAQQVADLVLAAEQARPGSSLRRARIASGRNPRLQASVAREQHCQQPTTVPTARPFTPPRDADALSS